MIEIIPAIIPETLEEIKNKISLLKSLPEGLVKKIQLDFVDGKYAPPVTWPFTDFQNQEDVHFAELGASFIIEADMFVQNPENFMDDFLEIGALSFVIHIDSTKNIKECIDKAKSAEVSIGLGVKPSLGMDLVEEFLPSINFVQFMGNDKVGYNGVRLSTEIDVFQKISDFHKLHLEIPIQIDIGVNPETAPKFAEVGVSALVSGSSVFEGEGSLEENINKLKNI